MTPSRMMKKILAAGACLIETRKTILFTGLL
jgi:hypothetical protein